MEETGDVTGVLGVNLDVPPVAGVEPMSADQVKARLLGISGLGIETHDHGDSVTVVWSAGVGGIGANTGLIVSYVYRALRLTLDPASRTVAGICLEREAELEIGPTGFLTGNWHKGQWVGSDVLNVGRWLGPHEVTGAAEGTGTGYEFDWAQLRDPIVEAVTGAGWTYHPERS